MEQWGSQYDAWRRSGGGDKEEEQDYTDYSGDTGTRSPDDEKIVEK